MNGFLLQLENTLKTEESLFKYVPRNDIDETDSTDEIERLENTMIVPEINLRTLFDWASHEWKQTSMKEKIEALRLMVQYKQQLSMVLQEYVFVCKQEGNTDRINSLPISLGYLFDYMFENKSALYLTKPDEKE